jgi:dienelactone hydrolase
VYIPGDQLVGSGVDASYPRRNPAEMQKIAQQMQAKLGTPFILLTRPGIFGSSGTHRERRREPEARLMQAAVDAIKQKHGIEEFALVGQSGGGHTVASLLGWRKDIACAVPTSAVSSPRARWEIKGLKRDATGFGDSYEPVDHLQGAAHHPKLRVFVLGDPRDSNTPWETQQPLARKLKALGVPTEVVEGEGAGGERHALGASGQLLGAMCLKGASTKEILDVAAKGLKG